MNIRRAASAALQEHVGRQGTFPNGIALLTLLDYHAVGSRQRSYLRLSSQVAQFEEYGAALVEHVLKHKVSISVVLILQVTHWDANVRELAGRALGVLARSLRSLVNTALSEHCLKGAEDDANPVQSFLVWGTFQVRRHGNLMALAYGLYGCMTLESGEPIVEHWEANVVVR